MIRFPCRCGHEFNVTDDQANESIQCPRCGLLCDVPGLGDLANIQPDGTYGLDVQPVRREPNRLADVYKAFTAERYDDEGNEFDLRTLPEELDLKPVTPERVKPRYDPETGELIRDLDVKPDPILDVHHDPASIPMARPAIEYAGGDVRPRVSPAGVALALFQPTNIIVMTIVFGLHILWDFGAFVVNGGMIFAVVFPLVLSVIILAHFGCVVDEIGVRDQDELPRPLRDLGLFEDVWDPFVGVCGAFMMSYLPLFLVVGRLPLPYSVKGVLVWVAVAVGTFAYPAVLLTLRTSGTLVNLRPDRVWGVIRACGAKYAIAVAVYVVAAVVYAAGVWGSFLVLLRWGLGMGLITDPLSNWYFAYPLLFAGIYLVHYLGWYLGLLYRAHHAQFPWLYQHHVPDPNRKQPRVVHPAAMRAARAANAQQPAPTLTKPTPVVAAAPVKPVKVIPAAPLPQSHSGKGGAPRSRLVAGVRQRTNST